MRKTFANPRRLLLLLIQIFLVVVAVVPYVGARPAQSKSRVVNLNGRSGGSSFVKTYQLISRCSDLRIQMKLSKSIDALGRKGSSYSNLNFTSDPSGAVRIRGNTSRKFLCFSKKGRLISRADGGSKRCMFREEVDHNHNFFKLRSEANNQWYVGFNKRGRKLKGYGRQNTWARRKCFMFIKEDAEGTRLPHRHLHGEYLNSDTGTSKLTVYRDSNR